VPEVTLRPLTARSVVLSLLLGTHPPELPAHQLVRAGRLFDISEPTLRVALTRMVAGGDLHRADSTYRLNSRHLQRQRRQDEAIEPHIKPWRGDWEIVAITAVGRPAAERAALRARLTELRLAELREGLWLRPANLQRPWPAELTESTQRFQGIPDLNPATLAKQLWNLDDWVQAAMDLNGRFATSDVPAERFTLAAAIVRHLLTDPILPGALLPTPWPGEILRCAYRAYQDEIVGPRRSASE
jgi:phenylacetic acid degradation operon negative regulatory protein